MWASAQRAGAGRSRTSPAHAGSVLARSRTNVSVRRHTRQLDIRVQNSGGKKKTSIGNINLGIISLLEVKPREQMNLLRECLGLVRR